MKFPAPYIVALLALPLSALACIQGGSHFPLVKAVVVPLSRPPEPPPKIDFGVPIPPVLKFQPVIEADASVTETDAHTFYHKLIATNEATPVPERGTDATTDYSAALLFVGRPSEAITVLVALEREHPGRYATAANLGTAYELTGDLKNALEWIRAGISRNPESHTGTEWLHVAILETKLRLQQNRHWLKTHSVLDAVPARPADETLKAIDYQLNERLRFVKPSDPVVADLFYQAAIRTKDPAAADRRAFYLNESLRFGSLRKSQIAKLNRAKA